MSSEEKLVHLLLVELINGLKNTLCPGIWSALGSAPMVSDAAVVNSTLWVLQHYMA